MSERYDSIRRIKTRAGIRYEANDRVTGDAVLLQRLPENIQVLMLDEKAFASAVDALPQLRHPNLVPVLDLGRDENGAFAVTEKVEGRTLTEWLVSSGTLQLPDFLSVATDCLQGIEAMEAAGISHGDVEPDKIVLKQDEESRVGAILTDPGLSRLTTQRNPKPGIPENRMMEFVSPEEIRGQALDIRTDLYTLACTLYYSFAGVTPFQGKSRMDVMNGHLEGRPTPITDRCEEMPAGIGRWLMAMLSYNPAHRPQTAARALGMLHVAASQPSGVIPMPQMAPEPQPPMPVAKPVPVPSAAPAIPRIPVPHAVPRVAASAPQPVPTAVPKVAAIRPPTAVPAQPTAIPRPLATPATPPAPRPTAVPPQQHTASPSTPRATPRVVATPATTTPLIPRPTALPQQVQTPRVVAKPGVPVPVPRAVVPRVVATPQPKPGVPPQK